MLIAFLSALPTAAAAASNTPFAPAAPYLLPTTSASCFCLHGGNCLLAWSFQPHGRFVHTARAHSYVIPIEGTWTQSPDGVVTVRSPFLCADVSAPPLKVAVLDKRNVPLLPKLRARIREFLATHPSDTFRAEDVEAISLADPADSGIRIVFDYGAGKQRVTRGELLILDVRIGHFVASPAAQHPQFVPLLYRGCVLLLTLPAPGLRDHTETLRAIDNGSAARLKCVPLMVPEKRMTRADGQLNPIVLPATTDPTGWFHAR